MLLVIRQIVAMLAVRIGELLLRKLQDDVDRLEMKKKEKSPL